MISVTNFDLPILSFTNGLAEAPAGLSKRLGLADICSTNYSRRRSERDGSSATWASSFYDARSSARENLRFLLRSATVTRPFSYVSGMGTDGNVYSLSSGNMWDADFFFARPPSRRITSPPVFISTILL
jgi:hypothetical protein